MSKPHSEPTMHCILLAIAVTILCRGHAKLCMIKNSVTNICSCRSIFEKFKLSTAEWMRKPKHSTKSKSPLRKYHLHAYQLQTQACCFTCLVICTTHGHMHKIFDSPVAIISQHSGPGAQPSNHAVYEHLSRSSTPAHRNID